MAGTPIRLYPAVLGALGVLLLPIVERAKRNSVLRSASCYVLLNYCFVRPTVISAVCHVALAVFEEFKTLQFTLLIVHSSGPKEAKCSMA